MSARTKAFLLIAIVAAAAFCRAPLALGVTADFRRDNRHPIWDNDGWNRGWDRTYYYVCQVRTTDGEIAFEVIQADEYKERLKELPELYKEACLQWKRDKKDADKNKEEFAGKKPARPLIKKATSRKYKEKDEAQAYADKLQKRWDEKMEKNRAKEEDKEKKAG